MAYLNRIKTSSGPSSIDADKYEIQRQQQLADMLQQQAMTPLPTDKGPISWTQGLAKLMEAYQANKGNSRVKDLVSALASKQDAAGQSLVEQLAAKPAGTIEDVQGGPATPMQSQVKDPAVIASLNSARAALPAEQGNRALAIALMQRQLPEPVSPSVMAQIQATAQQHKDDAAARAQENELNRQARKEALQAQLEATAANSKEAHAIQWQIAQLNAETKKAVAANGGAGGFGSAVNQRYTNRILTAAEEVGSGLDNLVSLPFGASTGVLGVGASPGSSIFSTASNALKNKVSPQEVQSYQTTIPGLAAMVATLESQGLAPPASRIHSFDSLMLGPEDTGFTRLEKMATFRQNSTNAFKASLSDPKVPEEQKQLLRDVQTKIETAIPYTFKDVQKLKQSKNPEATLGDFIKQSGVAPAAQAPQVGPYSDAEKERRYQEWKRTHPQ